MSLRSLIHGIDTQDVSKAEFLAAVSGDAPLSLGPPRQWRSGAISNNNVTIPTLGDEMWIIMSATVENNQRGATGFATYLYLKESPGMSWLMPQQTAAAGAGKVGWCIDPQLYPLVLSPYCALTLGDYGRQAGDTLYYNIRYYVVKQ